MSALRILMVEDEPIVALDVRHRLLRLGYQLAGVAARGDEAVAMAREIGPDLILMDIMLEGEMDGIEAAEAILAERDVPIIYATAYTDDATLARAKRTGPFGYVVKPFEDRELKLSVEIALYKHRMERQLVDKERLFSTTLATLGEAVLTTSPDGRITFLNPAAKHMLGLNGSAVGRPLEEVFALYEESGEPVLRPLHSLSDAAASRRDFLLRTAEGGTLPVSGTAAPLLDATGADLGMVLVSRDISRRKDDERALREGLDRLRQTLDQTVSALAGIVETRDPYTAGHQQRVAQLAEAMGARLGMDTEMRRGLFVSGQLHDIGKISIPAEILSKPARLTPEEMGLMHHHPQSGHDILHNVEFPWPVARTVLEHHERLDGSGYPQGLSGTGISLEARILSVADVVEAMSSHRPYRPALGNELALEEIRSRRGALYEPDAVDVCLELFRSGDFQFD